MKNEDEFANIDFSRTDVRASLARAYAAILEWQGPPEQAAGTEEGKAEGREAIPQKCISPGCKPATKRKRKSA